MGDLGGNIDALMMVAREGARDFYDVDITLVSRDNFFLFTPMLHEVAASDLDITNLRYETFGASGWFDPEEFTVRVPEKNAEVTVGKNQTIVEALEAAGLEVMSDCRKGECGLCEARIVKHTGKIDHRDVFYSEEQKHEGEKIACCVSRIISEGKPASIDIILT